MAADPTPDEKLTEAARMLEDIATATALMMIHGRHNGPRKVKELLGLDINVDAFYEGGSVR